MTDVFIHCELPSTLTLGTWTEWDGADSYCDPKKDYFKQRHRKCGDADGDQSIAYWCPGPWLEVLIITLLIIDQNLKWDESVGSGPAHSRGTKTFASRFRFGILVVA